MDVHDGGWRDDTARRIAWEAAGAGTVTLDEAVTPPLWRARDAGNSELVCAHDLGIVMDHLDRLAAAIARRDAFTGRHPQARFWTSASAAGPVRYHGSVPVGAQRIESGPYRELRELMDVMEALEARALEMRGSQQAR